MHGQAAGHPALWTDPRGPQSNRRKLYLGCLARVASTGGALELDTAFTGLSFFGFFASLLLRI